MPRVARGLAPTPDRSLPARPAGPRPLYSGPVSEDRRGSGYATGPAAHTSGDISAGYKVKRLPAGNVPMTGQAGSGHRGMSRPEQADAV